MKKWNNPEIINLGVENTNEGAGRRPNPNIPGKCGFCGQVFPNEAVFYEHETARDDFGGKYAGDECPEAPKNGEYESIFIPLAS